MSAPEHHERPMTTSGPSAPLDPHRTAPPGLVAWLVIGAGWMVMMIAVFGLFNDPKLGSPTSWVTWILGAAILHDAVVLPIVVGVGWLLGRSLPRPWRTPVRAALVVGAVVSLATFPIARRYGARADNPSILPLDVARNLLGLLAVLAVVAIAAGSVNMVRERRRTQRGVTE